MAGQPANGLMRRRIEVSGHLHRDPRPRGKLTGPSDEQVGVSWHPLKDGIGQHHIGVGLRRPRLHITDMGIDTPLARRFDHFR